MAVATPSRSVSNIGLNVKLIAIQFTFTNRNVVPSCVRKLTLEAPEEAWKRRMQVTGKEVIKPIPNVSLLQFVDQITPQGFQLVDGLSQLRTTPDGESTFHMVRFIFTRREYAKPEPEFVSRRLVVEAALKRMCKEAMWSLQVFRNPFYVEGEPKPGEEALSINLAARRPLLDGKGQPRKEWQKNPAGDQVGNEPVVIQPPHHLDFTADEMRIIDA